MLIKTESVQSLQTDVTPKLNSNRTPKIPIKIVAKDFTGTFNTMARIDGVIEATYA